jgi:hypothetical protein
MAVSTLALLATGITLVSIGQDPSSHTFLAPLGFGNDCVTVHLASFVV